MRDMTISRVAHEAGVGVETVRFYERRGLLERPPKPAEAGFRVYPREAVHRIRFIRQGQALGFSLREINELLGLLTDPAADCADMRRQAAAKLEEVDRKIRQLQDVRGALEGLIGACPGRGALQGCSIVGALVGDGERATGRPDGRGRETLT